MNPDKEVIEKIHAMPVDGAASKLVMHEFTLSMSPLKDLNGVTGKDVAKRLLDYGVMATLYFPMIVPECLMIEPTETESKEVLTSFAKDFHTILSEDPNIVTTAPHTTDVKRVDEVWAARKTHSSNIQVKMKFSYQNNNNNASSAISWMLYEIVTGYSVTQFGGV